MQGWGSQADNTLQIHCRPSLQSPGEAGCICLHKKLPVDWSPPGDQYIPGSTARSHLSENVCGFQQVHLQAVPPPGRGHQWKDRPECFQYHRILSGYHIHPAKYHKPRSLQVRCPAYVHLIS